MTDNQPTEVCVCVCVCAGRSTGSGDPDLYLRHGSMPTMQSYDYINNACDTCSGSTASGSVRPHQSSARRPSLTAQSGMGEGV